MKNYQFAKLFDFPNGQVLITKNMDEDTCHPIILFEIRKDYKNIELTAKISSDFTTNIQRDEQFKKIDQSQALSVFNSMMTTFNSKLF